MVGVLLVLGVRYLVAGPGDPDAPPTDRAGCTALTVTASPEKAALLGAVAQDDNRSNRVVDGRCVDVRITTLASGAGADALSRDWNEAANGPRPDVWSPAASAWAGILQ